MRSQEDIQIIKTLQSGIESLQIESEAHYENYRQMLKRIDVVVKERDAARAEAEQLKQALHDARLENSGQAAQLERKRLEPSRLEIAAMLLQGLLPMHVNSTDVDAVALKLADRLIKITKETK
jgi:hypothetical protein